MHTRQCPLHTPFFCIQGPPLSQAIVAVLYCPIAIDPPRRPSPLCVSSVCFIGEYSSRLSRVCLELSQLLDVAPGAGFEALLWIKRGCTLFLEWRVLKFKSRVNLAFEGRWPMVASLHGSSSSPPLSRFLHLSSPLLYSLCVTLSALFSLRLFTPLCPSFPFFLTRYYLLICYPPKEHL
ncbi:hypothetical protein BC939DRAFT_200238 [Gamsiella multidivaricata]|uniref:uncharacterized protein n=1 Tax=Gamsiella multidivaricata TaxID=101098 RepID=UPI00222086EE|nr:uncharacterized protein BC939DRAFT_200238 [Gamsiella multidivaricata]KAI7821928.1 hypothetical protein BC939DRAFT_200238 [Gamsiella multidivaricata]